MAAPVKVAIISPNQGAYGGLEAYVLALARFLAGRPDIKVRLVFKRVKGFKLRSELSAMVEQAGIQAEFVRRAGWDLARTAAWADVVHVQNASPDVVLLARIFARPIVVTIHFNFLMPSSLHKVLWRLAAMAAHERLYVSSFVRRTWEGETRRAHSRMVHSFCGQPGEGLPPGERRGFAFVGRWVENKGVDILVRAYGRAKLDRQRWPLRLMGTGPMEAEVRRSVAGPAAAGIEILGFVPDERKTEVIRHSKWMVVPPQTNEDLGLVPFEARCFGVPCIVTRDGGLPEAAGHEALLCEPGSAESLRAALERAAGMGEEEYAARSARTKDELRSQLTPMEFYPELYSTLAGSRRCKP